MLVAALIAYALQSQNKDYLSLAGNMVKGFPPVGPPAFHSSLPINSTTFKVCTVGTPDCVQANRTGLPDVLDVSTSVWSQSYFTVLYVISMWTDVNLFLNPFTPNS